MNKDRLIYIDSEVTERHHFKTFIVINGDDRERLRYDVSKLSMETLNRFVRVLNKSVNEGETNHHLQLCNHPEFGGWSVNWYHVHGRIE